MRETAAVRLLAWYDIHARTLPWRVSPQARAAGIRPDPYRVWLSEIMLQQTTVAAVKGYFERFTARWPDVSALAGAADAEVMAMWAGLGYYARARNLLKCARVVATELRGQFPLTQARLLELPGVGPYTAAAISAIAGDEPSVVVDGNVERVMARLFAVRAPLPGAKKALTQHAASLTPETRPGDYAQAVMDLGATICTPKRPACGICPWADLCEARRLGIAADLPARQPKAPKPTRRGMAYVGRRADGALLLERRPDKGLLGGTLGWPSSIWSDAPSEDPPADASWRDPGLEVRHTFTHFHLKLALRVADVPMDCAPSRGTFVPRDAFRASDLPTLMRKVHDLAIREGALAKPADTARED